MRIVFLKIKCLVQIHLGGLEKAMFALQSRMEILSRYIQQVREGTVPMNHAILREISSICQAVPFATSKEFGQEFNQVKLMQ